MLPRPGVRGPHPRGHGPGCPARSSFTVLEKNPVPRDLGYTESPPGRQILSVQQHTGLGAHKEQVLASVPRHTHQVVDGP